MKCQSCELDKAQLSIVSSKIVTTLDLKLCPACKFEGYEPRWVIILGARSKVNSPEIAGLVSKRKYLGEDIKLSEILG